MAERVSDLGAAVPQAPGSARAVADPKFLLFDVGVAGALVKRRIAEPRREQFGHALEHVGGIRNVPWEGFLSRLWAGEIIA